MKVNLSWLCGIFKRHSPSRHSVYMIFCKDCYRQKPKFLCKYCSQNQAPVRIKPYKLPLWKWKGNRAKIVFIDEIHDYKDDAIEKAIVEGMSRKEKDVNESECVRE